MHTMSEQLQTRAEHSRSLEDAERFRAIETLKEIGLLAPLSELETFHGRVGENHANEPWTVNPVFANGRNDNGNFNVNTRPTLYTGSRDNALEFARSRGREFIYPEYIEAMRDREANASKWPMSEVEKDDLWQSIARKYQGEIHDIVSVNPDAVVIDLNFDVQTLDEVTLEKYKGALNKLAIGVSEGSPLGFDDRHAFKPFKEVINRRLPTRIKQEEVSLYAEEAGIDESVALQLASAYNARQVMQIAPSYAAGRLLGSQRDIHTDVINLVNEGQVELPLNMEYVQRYFREAGIVGVQQPIYSATINRKMIAISLFDLEKVATEEQAKAQRQSTWRQVGQFAARLDEITEKTREQEGTDTRLPLLRAIQDDPHVKPEKIVELASQLTSFGHIFKEDTGNWEKFSLAEHTETVLQNFDENFADNLPVQMLAPMRLAILAHDIGKPAAAIKGEIHNQKDFNQIYANGFLKEVGLPVRDRKMILAIIGEGADLAFDINIRGAGQSAKAAMYKLAKDTLREYIRSRVSDEEINGFAAMCSMLQICDGGAYTSMGVTNKGRGNVSHRNAPSFNHSYAQPVGFGKRGIRLRRHDESSADHIQTPTADEEFFRV